jgi:hypothetical protein
MVNEKLKRVIWTVFFAILFFAYFDQTPSFLDSREMVFLSLWYFTFAIAAFIYWIFRKDVSEALSVFAVGMIEMFTGLEDYLFFVIYKLQGKAVELCVNHSLDALPFMNIADKYFLHNSCVTMTGLFINSVVIGGAASYFIFKWLEKQPW